MSQTRRDQPADEGKNGGAFGMWNVLLKFSWILFSCTLLGKTTVPR